MIEYYEIIRKGVEDAYLGWIRKGRYDIAEFLLDRQSKFLGADHIEDIREKGIVLIISQKYRTERDLYKYLLSGESLDLAGLTPEEKTTFMTIQDVK